MAAQKPGWLARSLVQFYHLVHGRLHLPGAGWLLRRAARILPELQDYPFPVPDVGTARLDFRDEGVFCLVNFRLGEFGPDGPLLRAIEKVIESGDVFWDVGANIGYLAQHLVRPEYRLGRIDAFEPGPVALKPLQSLFATHPRVKVHPIGLGARNETLEMKMCPLGSPNSSLVRELPDSVRVPISIRRGDDYRIEGHLPLPNVIKIDVEGFEPQVIEGLEKTIREARPIIFFEHIWISDDQVRALVPAGWELIFILDDGGFTRDMKLRHGGANAMIIPEEKRAALGGLFPGR